MDIDNDIEYAQAALEELNAHSTDGTWKLVPWPVGKKIIGFKWVFKVKHNADGSVERYKGRLVATSGKMDIAIMVIMDHNGP